MTCSGGWPPSSLSRRGACASLLHRLPPRPATAAAMMLERHPPVHLGLRPAAATVQLRRLPSGKYFSEEDEEEEAAEFVEDIVAQEEWEGFTLEYDHGSNADEDAAE
uniref:Uncharacterized protein n=1 Tax=Oryza glumipatula TaxID=40148 RepID=A0A0D9ZXT7_9ORYZ